MQWDQIKKSKSREKTFFKGGASRLRPLKGGFVYFRKVARPKDGGGGS